jgi:hypothetical protein
MAEDETLDERANRLARESIKAIAGLHKVKRMAAARNWHCQHCLTMWPCPTVSLMQDAEEAINEAEEEADDTVHHCAFMTHPGSMYVDPEPPEYCTNVVEHDGDLCPEHDD